jgi:cation transport ATPase
MGRGWKYRRRGKAGGLRAGQTRRQNTARWSGDGRNSAVNQAPVTGESIPIDKVAGDPVFAGTINETGILEFRVTAAADNTTLARIIHAVEQAQGTQAPTQRFVDRFAAIYTPTVFAIAVAVAILTPWLLGWTGRRRSTRPWCCWSSLAPARWCSPRR